MIEVSSKDKQFIAVKLNSGTHLFTDDAAMELIAKMTKILRSRGKSVEATNANPR